MGLPRNHIVDIDCVYYSTVLSVMSSQQDTHDDVNDSHDVVAGVTVVTTPLTKQQNEDNNIVNTSAADVPDPETEAEARASTKRNNKAWISCIFGAERTETIYPTSNDHVTNSHSQSKSSLRMQLQKQQVQVK